jgi:hypothetical protein
MSPAERALRITCPPAASVDPLFEAALTKALPSNPVIWLNDLWLMA